MLLSASAPARRYKLSHRINNELLYFTSAFVPSRRVSNSATNTNALTLPAILMKAFLLKYKWTIIFWIVFSGIVLYLAPRQHDYYLDDDIKNFKRTYLTPFLVWTGIVTSVIVLIFTFVKTKSIKQAGVSFLSVGVTLAFFLFIFQDIFLGASLFINRQVKRESIQKDYVVSYLAGTDQTKNNFFPYDLSTKHSSIDKKLKNKIYTSGLKQNDTVTLKFDKGLFGIAFQSKPFEDK